MAISKSAKIQAEIEKVTAKINEQQARLKELEQKKLEAENSEIVEIVRGMSVSLTDLPVLLQTIKNGGTLGQNVPKSADTFGKACHITLKDYLRNELEADTDDKAAGNSRTHIAFRKVWKTVAVAAITLTLLFSTCMVANAQFRERVISWVIETFEKYSIFELHGDELDELQDLTEYQAGYLPDGAILQDTTKQPNTEPGIVLYEYAINEAESFEIMITQSDNRVYFDTENTKIEPFDKGGVTGYFFQKDGMSYICFERDGCFFSVYGTADADELLKVAAGITKK